MIYGDVVVAAPYPTIVKTTVVGFVALFGLALPPAFAFGCSSSVEGPAGSGPVEPAGDASRPNDDAASSIANDGATCGDTKSDPSNCGACGHSCGGAACADGLCAAEVISTNGPSRDDPVVVAGTSLLYLSNAVFLKPDGTSEPMGLHQIDAKPGSSAKRILTTPPIDGGRRAFLTGGGLVVDYRRIENTSFVTAIGRVAETGGAVTQLVASAGDWTTDGTTLLYLEAKDYPRVLSMPLAGGTPKLLPTTLGASDPLGAFIPVRVLVDAGDLYVYGVSGTFTTPRPHALFALPKDGSKTTKVATFNEKEKDAVVTIVNGVIVGQTTIEEANPAKACEEKGAVTLWTAPIATPHTRTTIGRYDGDLLASRSWSYWSAPYVDGKTVWFRDACDGSLWTFPVSGGAPRRIWKSSREKPREGGRFAVGETHLYFEGDVGGETAFLRLAR